MTADTPEVRNVWGRTWLLPAVILLSGLLVFVGFGVACRLLYDQTEDRLLQQRTDEASVALALTVSQLRAPLDAAAALAEGTGGDVDAFVQVIAPDVGEGKSFASAVLYEVGSAAPLATTGEPPDLFDRPGAVDDLLVAAGTNSLVITDLLDPGRRLGYAVTSAVGGRRYVVYAERQLSVNPNIRRRTDEPFAGLEYAIYMGADEVDSRLLGSSSRSLPLDGRRAQAVSSFGDQQLLLVMSPLSSLSSAVFSHLWWMVILIGSCASLLVAVLSHRLLRRHHEALRLAMDNERLYDEQRSIAETLQLSLLPQVLEPAPGAQVAARYWPAGTASLIGGDFYDAFRVDEDRWAIAIGDVCGKGIEAASVTGLARHTLRAAARHSTSPASVLREVHRAMIDHRPPTFCTVCLIYVESPAPGLQHLVMSLGGHPPALLRHADGSVEEIGVAGTLLGIVEPHLTDARVPVGAGDTLVLYTDGLTDAPGDQAVPLAEVIDLLRVDGEVDPEDLADAIRVLKRRRRPHGSGDDTVVLVVRFGDWSSADGQDDSRIIEAAAQRVEDLSVAAGAAERRRDLGVRGDV